MKPAKRIFPVYLLILLMAACGNVKDMANSITGKEDVTIELSASRERIERGEAVTLNWQSTNAEHIRLVRVKDSLPPNGMLTLTPKTTTRYIISASKPQGLRKNKKQKAYAYAQVNVYRPKVEAFEAPARINYGDSVEFSWETKHAQYASIPGIADSLPPQGALKWKPDTTRMYSLYAHGEVGRGADSTKVKVNVTTQFKAPGKIWLGDSANLSWAIAKAHRVNISGLGERPAKGKQKVLIAEDSTFTLTAQQNNGNTIRLQRKVEVDTPRIRYFFGPEVVVNDEVALYSWHAEGNPYLKIEGRKDSLKAEDAAILSIKQDTTLTLIARYGNFYRTSVSLPVSVIENRGFVQDSIHRSDIPEGRRIDFDIMETDTSQYPDKMEIKVVPVDMEGNFVKGINRHNVHEHIANLYQSTHNGEMKPFSYNIKYVKEHKHKKLDFGIVMDYSGSMGFTVDSLVKAVKKFIELKHPQDRVSLVKFDEDLQLETPLNDTTEQLQEALLKTRYGLMAGGTALYAGASRGLKTLKKSGRKKIMILFTDGHENSSFSYLGDHAVTAYDLAMESRLVGAPLYVLAFGPAVNKPLLEALANASNGQYYHLFKSQQIEDVFNEIRTVSRQYYKITFKPLPYQGEHIVQLDYYNNSGGISTTGTKVSVDTDISLSKKEIPPDAYWAPNDGRTPVMPPQVVANFDFDKDNLKSIYYERVDRFIAHMEKNPGLAITIHGHTDQVGDWDYCIGLSERRAQAVADYMVEEGISPRRIRTKGWGMKHPVWEDEEADWQARENRRIEVVLYK